MPASLNLSGLVLMGQSGNPQIRQKAFEGIAGLLGTRFSLINCSIDGAGPANQRVLYRKKFLGTDFILSQCESCGLVFVNPQPTQATLKQMYSESYFKGGPEGWKEIGYRDYFGSESQYRVEAAQTNLKLIQQHHPAAGSLLDVGCACGFFLKVAKDAGWHVRGVEISEAAVNVARQRFALDLFCGTLEAAPFEADEFDVVSSFDVIEHVPDPMEHIRNVNRLLKPQGLLVLDTPNIDSRVALHQGENFWLIKADHIFYFSPSTLRMILEANGFEIVEISGRLLSKWDPALELFPGSTEGSHLTVVAKKSRGF